MNIYCRNPPLKVKFYLEKSVKIEMIDSGDPGHVIMHSCTLATQRISRTVVSMVISAIDSSGSARMLSYAPPTNFRWVPNENWAFKLGDLAFNTFLVLLYPRTESRLVTMTDMRAPLNWPLTMVTFRLWCQGIRVLCCLHKTLRDTILHFPSYREN